MCGILATVSTHPYAPDPVLQTRLQQRGPDALGRHTVVLQSTLNGTPAERTIVDCQASVLSLRGSSVVKQPVLSHCPSPAGSEQLAAVLCWNGEAWRYDDEDIPDGESDTEFISRRLTEAVQQDARERPSNTESSAVLDCLNSIVGPFAFFLLDNLNQRVYYGRDRLGRRSLLRKSIDDGFIIASVGDGTPGWDEVAADDIHCIHLDPADPLQPISFPYPALPFNTHPPPASTPPLTCASPPVHTLLHLLHQSLRPRTRTLPPTPTPRIAVLFSGGLDCTTLARLLHAHLPPAEPIDLLNVAFDNPRTSSPATTCPDRRTALSSLPALRAACPARSFRLLCINIPYPEYLAHRPEIISLMHPHKTEMDLSLAAALFFAARGRGTCYATGTPATTPARVLLSGLGADELFAGYARHATAYARGGAGALAQELALDVRRLGRRNLGRDDRVLARWARETRFPFLDEGVVEWAVRAGVREKCGFGEGEAEVGDDADVEAGKKVLRLVARRLGLGHVAGERKRAMQFGARSARMEVGGRTRGTDGVV